MLSSRPAASVSPALRKSSYPSPPLMTSKRQPAVGVSDARRPVSDEAVVAELSLEHRSDRWWWYLPAGSVVSTVVRNRTWPVCPCGTPAMLGRQPSRLVLEVRWGSGSVSRTPALVPTQSRSLQARSAVTLRQAALCCRMMSSHAGN